jgi:drug/metabolite transporter (DMT)-like permease
VFAAFVTMLLFSVSAICGHRSAKLLGGTEANFWRITFATAVLAVWAYSFGQGLTGAGLTLFLVSGILGIGIGDVAYFQSLPRLGPRLTLLLVQCLTAPIGALTEWVWLGTTLSFRQVLCGLTILVGVGIALAPSEHLHLKRRDLLIGIVAGLIASIGGAGGAVFSRKAYAVIHAAGEHIDPVSAGFQRVLGGLVLSGIILFFVKRNIRRSGSFAGEAPNGFSYERFRRASGWIVLNSLAGQTLGVSCMQWALETTPAGVVLPIIAMSPIAVIPMAFLVEGERPSIRSLVGGFVAVAGVIALTLAR